MKFKINNIEKEEETFVVKYTIIDTNTNGIINIPKINQDFSDEELKVLTRALTTKRQNNNESKKLNLKKLYKEEIEIIIPVKRKLTEGLRAGEKG